MYLICMIRIPIYQSPRSPSPKLVTAPIKKAFQLTERAAIELLRPFVVWLHFIFV